MDKTDRRDLDWRELCERASKEMDSDKLMELVRQLIDALDERDRGRLRRTPQSLSIVSRRRSEDGSRADTHRRRADG